MPLRSDLTPAGTDLHQPSRPSTIVAWIGIAIVLLSLGLTLNRIPTTEPDTQLYASVALSWARHDSGVPTVLHGSPYAVDHVGFYGPVYFDLAAWSLRAFGLSKWSVRLVSFTGALVLAAAAAGLSVSLGAPPGVWPWSILLVLLAPEVRYSAADGSMESWAVGLALSGLVCFVRALESRRPGWWASGAGVLFSLAALTTPRTYPLLAAFVTTGVLLLARDRARRRCLFIAGGWLTLMPAAWEWTYHGSVIRWMRLVAYVLTHEDTDVAILGRRLWGFSPSRAITPVVAVAAAMVGAWLIVERAKRTRRNIPAEFALVMTLITFALTFTGMNHTFEFGIYFALPLLTVVLALPWPHLGVPRQAIALALGALTTAYAGCAALTYARAALTWRARDPLRVEAFLRRHVAPGSIVVGPRTRYFFVVQAADSSYRTVAKRSFADWTRWVPVVDPQAMAAAETSAPSVSRKAAQRRFLLWPDGRPLPDGFGCVDRRHAAHYRASAPLSPTLTSMLGTRDLGYPDFSLFRMTDGCPTESDSTRAFGAAPTAGG